jgi:capsular polysaccharide biosynthesis protein
MEQQNREYDDEINLYDLWKVIAKRKMLIIGLFIVIVGLTAIVSFRLPDIYRGDAGLLVILKSEVITASEIRDFIGKIDSEKLLSIVLKSYPNIKNIQFSAIKDSKEDSKNKFVVTIDAKKIDDIPGALSEVVVYLNNIDIIKSAVNRDKAMLLKQSAELSDLVKSSPDLLATYNKLFSAGKLTMVGFNPLEVNEKIIDIKLELLGVEQKLSRLNNGGIEIAAQPYVSNRPVGPKILLNVVAAGISSLLLGIFLAFFIEYIGNIKNKKS